MMKWWILSEGGFGMTSRRTFLATAAAALATPAIATAGQIPADMPPRFKAQIVPVKRMFAAGEIHVTPWNHYLYYTLGHGQAIRYGVAVGAEGRNFTGVAEVGRKAEWPRWTPTADMIRREPDKYARYADGMEGGPDNPLGSRALYLYQNGQDTLFRIHGTPQPWTIGQSVSSGCIRMVNAHVEHLYKKVPIGATVRVYA